jgi:hypothetical protein
LQTRFTPLVQFVLDQGVKNSIEMTRLINEALAQSGPSRGNEPAEGTAEPDPTGKIEPNREAIPTVQQ